MTITKNMTMTMIFKVKIFRSISIVFGRAFFCGWPYIMAL